MMEVPVPDLLQMTHPGYRYIQQMRPLDTAEIPTFLDFCRRLTERFEHYGEINITPPDLFSLLGATFETLLEDDNPITFLPASFVIQRLLDEFDELIDNMQKAFSTQPRVRGFYRDVASTLRRAY